MEKLSFSDCRHGTVVRLEDMVSNHPMSSTANIVQDIHDILQSYYEITRPRFVDNILKLVVGHFLVTGSDTPLKTFCPTFVGSLTSEELEQIAGESPSTKRRRTKLTKESSSLIEAQKILSRR